MTREKGIVITIEQGVATVVLLREGEHACGTCAACGGCCKLARAEFHTHALPTLAIGDQVTIEIPGPGAAAGATLLMLIPMLLIVGAIAAAALLQKQNLLPGGNGVALLIGLGLVLPWYALLAIYDRRLRRSPKHGPRIVSPPERAETQPIAPSKPG